MPLCDAAGASLSQLAAERESQFDERFSLTFPVNNIPAGVDESAVIETSKAALSNMLGSMGYFVGSSKVCRGRSRPPAIKVIVPLESQSSSPMHASAASSLCGRAKGFTVVACHWTSLAPAALL